MQNLAMTLEIFVKFARSFLIFVLFVYSIFPYMWVILNLRANFKPEIFLKKSQLFPARAHLKLRKLLLLFFDSLIHHHFWVTARLYIGMYSILSHVCRLFVIRNVYKISSEADILLILSIYLEPPTLRSIALSNRTKMANWGLWLGGFESGIQSSPVLQWQFFGVVWLGWVLIQ